MPRIGYKQSLEQRAAIGAGIRKAYAEGRHRGRRLKIIPSEYREMYHDIAHQLGDAVAAKRIVLDHIIIVERRRHLSAGYSIP
jgi:hypothetical protein